MAILEELKTRQASDKLRAGNLWSQTGYVFTTELGEACDPRNALRALTTAAKAAGLTTWGSTRCDTRPRQSCSAFGNAFIWARTRPAGVISMGFASHALH